MHERFDFDAQLTRIKGVYIIVKENVLKTPNHAGWQSFHTYRCFEESASLSYSDQTHEIIHINVNRIRAQTMTISFAS